MNINLTGVEATANKDTDGTLSSNSDTKYPSQKAVKTYADTKQSALGYTAENTTNKDATGGYAGLTLFKINFKNAANTFISFFTNSNTAARTYTFQDRNGTIADDIDLALKANLASPTFTGTPSLPSGAVSVTQTQGDNSTKIATTQYVDIATSKRPKTYNFVSGRALTSGSTSIDEVCFSIRIPAGTVAIGDAIRLYSSHSVNNSGNTKSFALWLSSANETVGQAISGSASKIGTLTGISGAAALSNGIVKHFGVRALTTLANVYDPTLSLGTDSGSIGAAGTGLATVPTLASDVYFVGTGNRASGSDTLTMITAQLIIFKAESYA